MVWSAAFIAQNKAQVCGSMCGANQKPRRLRKVSVPEGRAGERRNECRGVVEGRG